MHGNTREVALGVLIGLDELMVQITLRDLVRLIGDEQRHSRYFVKRAPSGVRAACEAG